MLNGRVEKVTTKRLFWANGYRNSYLLPAYLTLTYDTHGSKANLHPTQHTNILQRKQNTNQPIQSNPIQAKPTGVKPNQIQPNPTQPDPIQSNNNKKRSKKNNTARKKRVPNLTLEMWKEKKWSIESTQLNK